MNIAGLRMGSVTNFADFSTFRTHNLSRQPGLLEAFEAFFVGFTLTFII